MGVCKLPGGVHRRIDILSIPWEQKGAALLYFTGNAIVSCVGRRVLTPSSLTAACASTRAKTATH